MIALPPSSEHRHIPQLCDSVSDPSPGGSCGGGELGACDRVRVLERLLGELSGGGVRLGERGESESFSTIGDLLSWVALARRLMYANGFVQSVRAVLLGDFSLKYTKEPSCFAESVSTQTSHGCIDFL